MGFNPNWNYQSPVTGGANYQTARPRFGPWSTRSTGDAGYSFNLTFTDRPIEQVNYIRSWYEKFQRGFFTMIDWDNKKREHVGRFTAPPKVTPTANLRYNIAVTFEEIPGCPMRNYPSNWQEWSHELQVADDWLNPTVNTSSTVAGAWALQQSPQAAQEGLSTSIPRGYELLNATPTNGDFAQMEYGGWGFRMTFHYATTLGGCEVYLDGLQIAYIDLSGQGGTANGSGPIVPVINLESGQLVLTATNVPLGRHRVKVLALAQPGTYSANGATGVIFPAIEVMH